MIPPPADYRPDRALHPGKFLKEQLTERGMTQKELAQRMGRPPQVLNQIVREKKAITPETALGLEKVLGIDAHFWTNLQSIYDLVVARMAEDEELADLQGDWLRRFPIRKMIELGWIEEETRVPAKLRQLLKFFAVPSLETLPPATEAIGFRASEKAKIDEWALRAWLRQGERVAQARDTALFDSKKFEATVTEIRSLTSDDPQVFAPRMKQLCADAGVALVLLPHLPKTGANGVARWLGPNKAMIQLNLRYRWADIFWFTFFHEAAHVMQHETKHVFVDLAGDDRRLPNEIDADTFASDTLIPRVHWDEFIQRGVFSSASVRVFAGEMALHPGIVVGRLHHEERLPHNRLNDLRSRLQFVPPPAHP